MKNVSISFTFIAISSFVVLYVLQWIPITGIFLMFVGAPFLQGLLLHAVLLALVVDVVKGKFSRFLIVIPILVYGGYFAMYFVQWQEINRREAQLKATNPGMLLKFDATKHSLVSTHGGNVVNILKIPVAYELTPDMKPEGYAAYRSMTEEKCHAVKQDSLARISRSYFATKQLPDANNRNGKSLCRLRNPEVPDKEIVTIEVQSAEVGKRKAGLSEEIYKLSFKGKVLGEYRKAHVYQYTLLPFPLIGCFLNSGEAKWECRAEFSKTFRILETAPDTSEAKKANGSPIGTMLGLEAWSFDELQKFSGWDSNKDAMTHIAGESLRVDENAFASLDKLIADPKAEVPWNMAYSLSTNAALASQNSQKMVDLFKVLAGPMKKEFYAGEEKLRAISAALAALPAKDFARHVDELIAAHDDSRLLDLSMVFYVRMADFSDRFADQYSNDLVSEKTWMKLASGYAICRLGKADENLKRILRYKFHDPNIMDDRDLSESLFLALVGVGEASFAEAEIKSHKPRYPEWYLNVLDDFRNRGGKPNNCMPRRWPATEFVGPEMAGWLK